MNPQSFRIVIPARYSSTRLPGKPLVDLAGEPLVVHVLRNALRADAREVIVATDDQRVIDVVTGAGGRAVMTSPSHPTGTDRLAQVANDLGWADDDIVVNLQGDEPLVAPDTINGLAQALQTHTEAGIATMAVAIREATDVFKPQVVKVVVDRAGFALYFSRAPIPWARDSFRPDEATELPSNTPFLRHLGLYAYRVGVLRRLTAEPPDAYETAESLEQLRALVMGIPIHVTTLSEAPAHGVDTPEDVERVRRVLASR